MPKDWYTAGIKLKATNSSGKQKLYFNFQDDKYCDKNVSATLWGVYDNNELQIDFNSISLKKLKKMQKVLKKMIKLKEGYESRSKSKTEWKNT